MPVVGNLAQHMGQSTLWPAALPAADLLLAPLLKLLPPASSASTLTSSDLREDVKHLYNNEDSKPHRVQREVIFTT